MIYYPTKTTKEKYKIELYNESGITQEDILKAYLPEDGSDLFKWGLKVFHFQRKKCLQVTNFASKLTIFLVDVKTKDIEEVPNMVEMCVKMLFDYDEDFSNIVEKYFSEAGDIVYDALKDRKIISALNNNERNYLGNGDVLNDFIDETGTLYLMDMNYDYNFNYLASKNIDGKKEYIFPAEEFMKLLILRYRDKLR